jgi:hypothetical protein
MRDVATHPTVMGERMRWRGSASILLLCIAACGGSGGADSEMLDTAGQGAAVVSGNGGGGHTAGTSSAGVAGSSGAQVGAPDRDGDGVPDADDAFPDDPTEWLDTDRDGVGDNADISPNNPLSCGDSDRDGCDDCVTGRSDPDNDGPDRDGDGACDACDITRCNGQGTCRASPAGAVCECDAPWSGDDCTADADACAAADPIDGNPCNTRDPGARCSDDPAPAATYRCTCGPGHAFDGVTCVVADGFIGDEVSARMPTVAAGPLFSSGTTAIVGPGVEFSSRNQPGFAGVDLDIAAHSFTFSLVNENPNAAFNQGLLRIEITDLQSVEHPGSVIVSVALTNSTFPDGTFDAVSFGPDWITLDVSEPNLVVPRQTTWTATFAVETR